MKAMTDSEFADFIILARAWFREKIAEPHIDQLKSKLREASEFQINPFLAQYLASAYTGKLDYESLAETLIVPRWLGTSISTSFGGKLQSFVTETVKDAKGSLIPGMDIEFTDLVDQQVKYCQLKAGPNTINKDDVEPMKAKFQRAINLARANKFKVSTDSFGVGVLYGAESDLNAFYKEVKVDYDVWVGADFWHRLTGRDDSYQKLYKAIQSEAASFNASSEFRATVKALAESLEKLEII